MRSCKLERILRPCSYPSYATSGRIAGGAWVFQTCGIRRSWFNPSVPARQRRANAGVVMRPRQERTIVAAVSSLLRLIAEPVTVTAVHARHLGIVGHRIEGVRVDPEHQPAAGAGTLAAEEPLLVDRHGDLKAHRVAVATDQPRPVGHQERVIEIEHGDHCDRTWRHFHIHIRRTCATLTEPS